MYDKEIEGMGFDNEIKNKSKEAIIGNYFADLKVKAQQVIESQSKVKLNEKQQNVFDATIEDIKSTITNRDMTEEARRKSIESQSLPKRTSMKKTLPRWEVSTTRPCA